MAFATQVWPLCALVVLSVGCAGRLSDARERERMSALGLRANAVRESGRTLSYVDSGEQGRPVALFIHGSPGRWHNFDKALSDPRLRARFRVVAVDRPGFGRSSSGGVESSLRRQARLIGAALEEAAGEGGAIVVGHSLGGPVAARLALDFPNRVSGLVLAAPSLDPDLERLRWYNRAAQWIPIQWLLPNEWVVSNREIVPLRNELIALAAELAQITAPVAVIHGKRDRLVPVENADFARRAFPNAKVSVRRMPEQGHFLPWTATDALVDAILETVQRPL